MYAVIISGGKQYRVEAGQTIRIGNLEAGPGDVVEFDKVLMLVDGDKTQLGKPFLSGCAVKAKVVKTGRGDKIKIIKMRRRKHHIKRMGHRQSYTEVEITGIKAA